MSRSSRNAIDVYDPEILARQAQLEVQRKMAESGAPRQRQPVDPNAPIFRMFADIAAKEQERFAQREEERRRRDPTYRPDALDFAAEAVREFDEKVDYYRRLQLDQFASAGEIKRAYMRLSLKYHPDKQVGKELAEAEAALDKFKQLTEAYEILGDQANRVVDPRRPCQRLPNMAVASCGRRRGGSTTGRATRSRRRPTWGWAASRKEAPRRRRASTSRCRYIVDPMDL